jgi:hypothetical protein
MTTAMRPREGGQLRPEPIHLKRGLRGGGIKAAAVAADCGLAQGRGGRVDVQPDLAVPSTPAST